LFGGVVELVPNVMQGYLVSGCGGYNALFGEKETLV
jgi:hypothetical protein